MKSIPPVMLALVLLLPHCSNSPKPTPYQRMTANGGYTDMNIKDTQYLIHFRGNRVTPRTIIENYALLRAAQVAIENGFQYFIILKDKSKELIASHNDQQTTFFKIQCFKEPPNSEYNTIYEAKKVSSLIRKRYKIKRRKKAGSAAKHCVIKSKNQKWSLVQGSCKNRFKLATGQGRARSEAGHIYQGEFWQGWFYGQGTYKWPDGSVYVGEFEKGKPHGNGTKVFPDGIRKEGEWKEGRFISKED